jgi:hypothetical protein
MMMPPHICKPILHKRKRKVDTVCLGHKHNGKRRAVTLELVRQLPELLPQTLGLLGNHARDVTCKLARLAQPVPRRCADLLTRPTLVRRERRARLPELRQELDDIVFDVISERDVGDFEKIR